MTPKIFSLVGDRFLLVERSRFEKVPRLVNLDAIQRIWKLDKEIRIELTSPDEDQITVTFGDSSDWGWKQLTTALKKGGSCGKGQ